MGKALVPYRQKKKGAKVARRAERLANRETPDAVPVESNVEDDAVLHMDFEELEELPHESDQTFDE